MNSPIGKNKSWISLLHKSIAGLGQQMQAEIMKPCGQGCAEDSLLLCEEILRRKVSSIEDLIEGWNIRRKERGLSGKWVFEENAIRGVFNECSCPLVASGLVELHPLQCLKRHCQIRRQRRFMHIRSSPWLRPEWIFFLRQQYRHCRKQPAWHPQWLRQEFPMLSASSSAETACSLTGHP